MILVSPVDEQITRPAPERLAELVHRARLNAAERAPRTSQAVAGRDRQAGQFGELIGSHVPLSQQLGNVETHHASKVGAPGGASTFPPLGQYYPVERIVTSPHHGESMTSNTVTRLPARRTFGHIYRRGRVWWVRVVVHGRRTDLVYAPHRSKQKPPPRPLDTAAALYDKATTVHGRIARLAPFATPAMRLRLMGELALVENVLDPQEDAVVQEAKRTLAQLTKRRRTP